MPLKFSLTIHTYIWNELLHIWEPWGGFIKSSDSLKSKDLTNYQMDSFKLILEVVVNKVLTGVVQNHGRCNLNLKLWVWDEHVNPCKMMCCMLWILAKESLFEFILRDFSDGVSLVILWWNYLAISIGNYKLRKCVCPFH